MTQLIGSQDRLSDPVPRRVVSVAELKRAWNAVQAGAFDARGALDSTTVPVSRRDMSATRSSEAPPVDERPRPPSQWIPAPGERVVTVVGCAGSVGVSTLALAIASAQVPTETSSKPTSRVVECAPVTACGLGGASLTELGTDPDSGWVRGTRPVEHPHVKDREVLIEHTDRVFASPEDVSVPPGHSRAIGLTVLDVGWEIGQILSTRGWVGDHVRTTDSLVLVSVATVPGLRRLEAALDLLADASDTVRREPVVVALVGSRRGRLPRAVVHSAGPRTKRLLGADRVVVVPHHPGLAVAGVDTSPLPGPVLSAAARVLALASNRCQAGTPPMTSADRKEL